MSPIFPGAEHAVHFRRSLPLLRGREHRPAAAFRRRASQNSYLCKALADGGKGARQGSQDWPRRRQADEQGEFVTNFPENIYFTIFVI